MADTLFSPQDAAPLDALRVGAPHLVAIDLATSSASPSTTTASTPSA